MKTLIIVESPAKAKKIQSFLKNDYIVKSSYGHIRELDKKKLELMIDNNFEPKYTMINNKIKILNELKSIKYNNIILAADDDREGDAIAWHCGRLFHHWSGRLTHTPYLCGRNRCCNCQPSGTTTPNTIGKRGCRHRHCIPCIV